MADSKKVADEKKKAEEEEAQRLRDQNQESTPADGTERREPYDPRLKPEGQE